MEVVDDHVAVFVTTVEGLVSAATVCCAWRARGQGSVLPAEESIAIITGPFVVLRAFKVLKVSWKQAQRGLGTFAQSILRIHRLNVVVDTMR